MVWENQLGKPDLDPNREITTLYLCGLRYMEQQKLWGINLTKHAAYTLTEDHKKLVYAVFTANWFMGIKPLWFVIKIPEYVRARCVMYNTLEIYEYENEPIQMAVSFMRTSDKFLTYLDELTKEEIANMKLA